MVRRPVERRYGVFGVPRAFLLDVSQMSENIQLKGHVDYMSVFTIYPIDSHSIREQEKVMIRLISPDAIVSPLQDNLPSRALIGPSDYLGVGHEGADKVANMTLACS
jgi:hypothetical protein